MRWPPQVPETCLIEFVGEPRFGVGGKDIILHVREWGGEMRAA